MIQTKTFEPEPRRLPDGLEVARTTPSWTMANVPKALLSAHQAGVWAELVVEDGRVEFLEHGTGRKVTVGRGERTVIAPGIDHHIAPTPDAAFAIRFYRDVDESTDESVDDGALDA